MSPRDCSCPAPAPSGRVPLAGALVAALLAAGCPAKTDPCSTTTCPAGQTCKAVGDAAVCTPPANPCSPDPCKATELCTLGADGQAKCVTRDLCRYVSCPADKACDPATGQCSVARQPCQGVVCPAGTACNATTGECEAAQQKCADICCPWDTVCDPATGACVDNLCLDQDVRCKCSATQACEPMTGACIDIPGPCPHCEAGQYCDRVSGACIDIPTGTPATGEIGSPCASAADCGRSGGGAFCITDGGLFGDMPGGSCSANCDLSGCPEGSACVDVGLQVCLDICRRDTDCRPGYACSQITSDSALGFCFPEGAGASRCTGTTCRTLGSPCTEDAQCVAGAVCRTDLPGGYCMMSNCRPSNCDAPSEACVCLGTGDCANSTIGLGTCDVNLQDCRAGYSCYQLQSNSSRGYCYLRSCEGDSDCQGNGSPWCDVCDTARGVCNAPCTKNADCGGGRLCDTTTKRCYQGCRSEGDWCGPDALCDAAARRCVRRCLSDTNCAATSYCEPSSGRCIPRCAVDSDCTGGKLCDRRGRCRAPCAADAECGTAEICADSRCVPRCSGAGGCAFGESCDAASGRCRTDLAMVAVGRACSRDADCGPYNATCLLEGWTGGYCSSTACSTDVQSPVPCPAGAACVSDGAGGHRCLTRCTPGTAGTCRQGYTCTAEGADNVCKP